MLQQRLLTVGHGTSGRDELAGILKAAGVELLVDVRRYPGSRNNPDVRRDALTEWLPDAGIRYRWEERLGGRRRLPAGTVSEDPWWQVAQFRAYAAHTRTAEFVAGLDEALAEAGTAAVAVMCSETVWWRCHRRLIADVAELGRQVPTTHIIGAKQSRHRVAEGARLRADGFVVWDA